MIIRPCIFPNDVLLESLRLKARLANNFIMSMISALAVYCFFDNKSQALEGYNIEDTKQLIQF